MEVEAWHHGKQLQRQWFQIQLSMSMGMCLLMASPPPPEAAWGRRCCGLSLGEQSKRPQWMESSEPPRTRSSVAFHDGTAFSASLINDNDRVEERIFYEVACISG